MPAGRAAWLDRLRSGMTRTDVAVSFYGSVESRRRRVARLYDEVLDRSPDGAGRDFWVDNVEAMNELFTAGVVAGVGDLFTLAVISGVMVIIDWRLALAAFVVLLADAQEQDGLERRLVERSMPLTDGFVIASSRLSDTELRSLAKTAPVVVYCAGGVRSAFAARTMQELGYTDVVSMDGGFGRWKGRTFRQRRR